MKLLASHLGGTRNPLAIRWPKKVAPDPVPRDHFLHCNDVVPTIYDIVGIEPPLMVNGVPQIPIAGASFASTLTDPSAPGGKKTQYFEVMGSRAIYHDGWMASTFGPRVPWLPGLPPGIQDWTPDNDRWELYHLDEDWSQAHDLAAEMPDKLAQMRELFAIEAARNSVLPIGGGLWVPIFHPELRITPPYREWEFPGEITRMPEFCAPALGTRTTSSLSRPTCPPTPAESFTLSAALPAGSPATSTTGTCATSTTVSSSPAPRFARRPNCRPAPPRSSWRPRYAEQRPGGTARHTIRVGQEVLATGRVPVSAPLLFTANDCFDIGFCLGSPVSLDYYDKAPFPFNGQIDRVHVAYT